jgi:gamma-glutamylcyclotransferase (GGCT)/AIG2-like uncharacterized protein YtfP
MMKASIPSRRQARKHIESAVPSNMFFYGSLMGPEVLQGVLSLDTVPIFEKASINGFAIKMWGIYPALIPHDDDSEVSGTTWLVNDFAQFARLEEYETKAYSWTTCVINKADGDSLEGCRTFVWGGDPSSRDLNDGSFDLERDQKYFKPSILKKGP